MPSSGRWSFKLRFGSRKGGNSDVTGGSSGSNSNSRIKDDSGNNGGGIDERDTQQGGTEVDTPNTESANDNNVNINGSNPQDLDTGSDQAGGAPQEASAGREGEHHDAFSEVWNARSTSHNSPAEQEPQQHSMTEPVSPGEVPPPVTHNPAAKEPTTPPSIWPGRALCREVAEKYLSWEFYDSDFCVPDGVIAESGDDEETEEMEEEAAVRAALVRREAKLQAAMRGIEINDEPGGGGGRGGGLCG